MKYLLILIAGSLFQSQLGASWTRIIHRDDPSGYQWIGTQWAYDAGDGWKYLPHAGIWVHATSGWEENIRWQDSSGWHQVDLQWVFETGTGWMQIEASTGWMHIFDQPDGPPESREFALIPAGSFLMGDSFNEGNWWEWPVHEVEVSTFQMQKTEVTNAQFADVMNWAIAQGDVEVRYFVLWYQDSSKLLQSGQLWKEGHELNWNGSRLMVLPGREDHPCVNVTWFGAMAYCYFLTEMEGLLNQAVDLQDWSMDLSASGYRLPTEAEWEKAARGGLVGKRFPWGDTIDHSKANYRANGERFSYDTSSYTTETWHPDWVGDSSVNPFTCSVTTFPPNGFGLYQMADNVSEWCFDAYASNYYETSPSKDPMGPPAYGVNILRGGTCSSAADICRVTYRFGNQASGTGSNTGFRVVRSE
ncbi:formylglycine-generating enzyme family protein [Puniceicoccales bacterium CK1056]|uniref:Formylglycine-generating enzyme family protein n=1 Tax=Oceanipulchritudo coccoides TaxID=2706888 RepID=A0A6B2M1T7_9BACT|nr:SUMF1/EgtB/PvdO family nonheme iron enzyme [Oceanipulchritudo coccoides]NDV62971.1 formylglycine-generating enzyme family protein [Oceanipulchritudo coccoides]